MHTSAKGVGALIAVVAAAVLGGCSSSKSGSSSAHKTFVSQGNAICARYNAQIDPISQQAGNVITSNPNQAADLLAQEISLVQKGIGELAALQGPKADTDQLAMALAIERQGVADGLATVQASRSGQTDEANRLIDKSNSESAKSNAPLNAAGLTTCTDTGSGSSSS